MNIPRLRTSFHLREPVYVFSAEQVRLFSQKADKCHLCGNSQNECYLSMAGEAYKEPEHEVRYQYQTLGEAGDAAIDPDHEVDDLADYPGEKAAQALADQENDPDGHKGSSVGSIDPSERTLEGDCG